jgi:hypothetical protein
MSVGVDLTADHDDRFFVGTCRLDYFSHYLASEARGIKASFTGDDKITVGECCSKTNFVRHEIKAGHESCAECGEPTRETTSGATTRQCAHIDAESREIVVGCTFESRSEKPHLLVGRTLLRRERFGGVDEHRAHITRHNEVNVTQHLVLGDCLHGTKTTVSRC